MITYGDDLPFPQEEAPRVQPQIPMRLRLSPEDRRMFINSMTNDLETIRNAWSRRDPIELLARVHSLKGALLVMGESAGAKACMAAEEHIHARGMKASRRRVERLIASLCGILDLYAEAAHP